MTPHLRGHLLCIFIYMASGKYPIFNRSKNPFNKNTRTPPSTTKKSSEMFDENYNGIITTAKTYVTDYYETVNELGYYNIENESTYYQDLSDTSNIFHVNYIQDIQNDLNK
jgi:hypothetical protein